MDPPRRNTCRKCRTLLEICFDHGRCTEKFHAVMRDQGKWNRIRVEIFVAQTAGNVVEWMAGISPPCLPDPVGHGVEKLRSLPQVGNRKGHCCFHVKTTTKTRTAKLNLLN